MDTSLDYRFGFAVKVLGDGGLKTSDTRRAQSGPHLRHSLALLGPVFDYLDRIDVRVFRLSSSTVPYGTHPDLPELDYRRQIDECADELERLGERARDLGLRLSTHPGQYTVLSTPDESLAAKSRADLEQDALLLDALGQPEEAVVVVHVGGAYGEPGPALERWAREFQRLSERAQRRVVVEHDETSFDLADVLGLHARTGVRVVFDHHHHRCNPSDAGVADALATWPEDVRPKVHLSSPRTELRQTTRGPRPPLLSQHADFISPWDAAELLGALTRPADVVLEAKAKDLALLRLRDQLRQLFPELSSREAMRGARARARRPRAAASPARTPARS